MSITPAFAFLLTFFLAFSLVKPQPLQGSVRCLDCPLNSDLSGLQVLVKCDKVKKLAMAYTEEDGGFTTELPSDGTGTATATPSNCMAKMMGGPHQLYISNKDSVVAITSAKEKGGHFTTATPLTFYKACPEKGRCGGKDNGFASSKTVDVPLPREWGLAPSSYYVPFIPIIGIP
ncbi:hypothetical protein SASPL_101314 [Salvia splendens]|uniref:Uncharacterized protein n=1 Tax=Salvia splendens TaxID=180675 RepID=A0A8X8YPU4_SALSN|nr:uncharacterized protein LOC121802936 [Salvia splendens]KAG6436416.1 hypothetical protein SASPL_101314 [Salvia splendens]